MVCTSLRLIVCASLLLEKKGDKPVHKFEGFIEPLEAPVSLAHVKFSVACSGEPPDERKSSGQDPPALFLYHTAHICHPSPPSGSSSPAAQGKESKRRVKDERPKPA